MELEHRLAAPNRLTSPTEETAILSDFIKEVARNRGRLNILEAGCGRRWSIDLDGVEYDLVGIDVDEAALALRNETQGDLSLSIIGDLRTAEFEDASFDVIYNAFVLEHIDGAEIVLDNFVRWLTPGGCIILKIPNRDSVKGFFTRVTPFWFHVSYKKYFRGIRNAGKPGFGPYPTAFDKVVSRRGIDRYCRERGLELVGEYYYDYQNSALAKKKSHQMEKSFSSLVEALSIGNLSANHIDMLYVIRKP